MSAAGVLSFLLAGTFVGRPFLDWEILVTGRVRDGSLQDCGVGPLCKQQLVACYSTCIKLAYNEFGGQLEYRYTLNREISFVWRLLIREVVLWCSCCPHCICCTEGARDIPSQTQTSSS